ncbi:UNVERIFIED_CONTAM: hypothetical protein GTU68_066661, partial [Idotea baltica]|nr:hypothetical protein [Idotea baltica]
SSDPPGRQTPTPFRRSYTPSRPSTKTPTWVRLKSWPIAFWRLPTRSSLGTWTEAEVDPPSATGEAKGPEEPLGFHLSSRRFHYNSNKKLKFPWLGLGRAKACHATPGFYTLD